MRLLIACAAVAASLLAPAQAAQMPSRALERRDAVPATFRAPHLAPKRAITLGPMAKSEEGAVETTGPTRVGTVRALAKAASLDDWTAIAGGYVSVLTASSEGATGLRVRLDVAGLSAPVEVRVQGAEGRIESMLADPRNSAEAWTPWTGGDTQRIEIFSAGRQPAEGAVRVGAIVHFTASPFEKAAAACTISTSCSTNDAALDTGIAERKKSIMRINFVRGAGSFMCSATLINTDHFPAPYILTANHCVDRAEAANSVASWWFYESVGCGSTSEVNPNFEQVAGGADLVFGNHNVDSSLLLLRRSPPDAAVYAGWNATRLTGGTPVVSLSHPTGDTSRTAIGLTTREYGIFGTAQPMSGVRFSRGIIEGGSSGSGLFALAGGSLQLRGVLSGSTVRNAAGGMSCTNLDEDALYGRFDIFLPQIAPYVRLPAQAADDAPNRPQDLFDSPVGAEAPLNTRAAPMTFANRRIDYAGDMDTYRFVLSAPAVVTASTEGPNIDTVGAILDSRGVSLQSNDDAVVSNNHFGLTRQLGAGTYYVQVGHFEAQATGSYSLRIRADALDTNRTALWWNPAESGWGLNVNHQGNIIFGTLFTYDANGAPMWLVMDRGERQSDGAYVGTLYRASGPAFNAIPFSGVTLQTVGTMRLTFAGSSVGMVTYSVNGVQVTKGITRQEFSSPVPNCTWSAFDRTFEQNVQDLWWKPSEPGWGINLAHQGDIVFATLFTYDASGRGLWLVMSNGARSGGTYSGPLYRMSGPAFNASTWTTAVPTQVGTMSLTFAHGNSATLTYSVNGVQVTKQIERQVFQDIKPLCES